MRVFGTGTAQADPGERQRRDPQAGLRRIPEVLHRGHHLDVEGDRTLAGKDAVRQWMQTAYVEAPDFKVHRMIADGESLAALGEIMVKDGQGQPVRHSYCDVWRFRDGLMAELRAFVIKAL
jgi:ketosteroid isomerase-like protein